MTDRAVLVLRLLDLQATIAGAKAALADLQKDAQAVVDSIAKHDYDTLFAEVTSRPLDWSKLCWPSGPNVGILEGDVDKLCIVCRELIGGKLGAHFSGGPVGSTFAKRFSIPGRELYSGPRLLVHKSCVPQRQLDLMSCD